jgi:hypothetical protein
MQGAERLKRLGLALGLLLAIPAGAERLDVARFSAGDLDGWKSRSFAGETQYRLEFHAGRRVLHAVSNDSASGLYREMTIDLKETRYLHWSWRVGNLPATKDERSKAGDDYAARTYVVFSGGSFYWRTRAINYVWSSHQPPGSEWPNAFTANARMIAVRSGVAEVGQWLHQSRNVYDDYRRAFGEEPAEVSAIAVMTDTDNTGQSAEAWFGDIWFAPD